jgi:hypothetical protein
MVVSEIELFEALAKELGNEKAKSPVEYVEHKVDKRLEEKTNLFATKEDIANAKVDILRWTVGLFLVMLLTIVGLYFKH